MQITIHRGIDQIGGCITEIATDKARILIDLGGNLPSSDGAQDPLESEEAVATLTNGVDAIFYTHYHGDHVSLYPLVPKSVPQYIGAGALEVMKVQKRRLAKVSAEQEKAYEDIGRFKTYTTRETIEVGDIRVTPFFTSHSAFDSYMLLVEADGKRILHTGDFRGHGYLSRPLTEENPQKNMLRCYVAPVDIVITEGTMLSRSKEGVMSEAELKEKMQEFLTDKKYVFVLCSSTDIDRLSSIYRATASHHRPLVCDSYQKDVLQVFDRLAGNKGPYYKFDEQKIKDFIGQRGGISEKQLAFMRNQGFCALVRPSQHAAVQKLVEHFGRENCHLVYSMWRGYYDGSVPSAVNPKVQQLRSQFDADKIKNLHTSGHADCKTLEKVLAILNPSEAIIGIHKDAGTSLTQLELPEALKAKIVPENNNPDYIKIVK